MIEIKKGTIDSIQFTLMQLLDNERIALPLITATEVRFHAKQKGPSENMGDPAIPKTINKLCTIVNPVTGVVTASLTSTDTNTQGTYDCYIEVKYPASTVYCKFPFVMTIWDV